MKVNLIFKSEQAALDKLRENRIFCLNAAQLFPAFKFELIDHVSRKGLILLGPPIAPLIFKKANLCA